MVNSTHPSPQAESVQPSMWRLI